MQEETFDQQIQFVYWQTRAGEAVQDEVLVGGPLLVRVLHCTAWATV